VVWWTEKWTPRRRLPHYTVLSTTERMSEEQFEHHSDLALSSTPYALDAFVAEARAQRRVSAEERLQTSSMAKELQRLYVMWDKLVAERDGWRAEAAVLRSCREETDAGNGRCGICIECLRDELETLKKTTDEKIAAGIKKALDFAIACVGKKE
jgi:hypothetical protein